MCPRKNNFTPSELCNCGYYFHKQYHFFEVWLSGFIIFGKIYFFGVQVLKG